MNRVRHWRRNRNPVRSGIVYEIAPSVWGINPDRCSLAKLRSYQEHFEELRFYGLDKHIIVTASAVRRLVLAVKSSYKGTVRDAMIAIGNAQPACLDAGYDDESVKAALRFACKLWLFVDLETIHEDRYLKQLVEESLHRLICSPTGVQTLSKDFSQKTLVRKAGMRIMWTSKLCEHLKYDGEGAVYLFRHAQALGSYSPEAKWLFPDGFLNEANRTINLLFPQATAAISGERRNTRVSEKYLVDIELALPVSNDGLRDLSSYTFWKGRLGQLQTVYNEARPKRPKQWWFDRRNRNEWATFWIAVVVFCLTVFFGVIQSITGIVSAVFAYRALQLPPS